MTGMVLVLVLAGLFAVVSSFLPNPWADTESTASVSDPNPQLADKKLNARVEALLSKMTLDQKSGSSPNIRAAR